MFARIACWIVAVPLFAANPSSYAGTKPAELQGPWRLVSLEADAGAVALPTPPPTLVIKEDRLLYGGEEIARIFTDATTNPKVIDLRFPNPERVYEGVYAVEEDTLKICLNRRAETVKERPQSFSPKDRPGWRLLSFERVKADNGEAGNGFVGMALRLDQNRGEVIVGETFPNSPAKKAGLRKDDVLLEVGDLRVTDLLSAVRAVRQAKPGSEVAFNVRRDGKERKVTVKVGLFPFPGLIGLE